MIYLEERADGVTNFDSYFKYIDSIRNRLSERAYAFASNWDHYSLDSKSSLHDCWLESVDIQEIGSGERLENREMQVSISFLGAYHDRRIRLVYHDVTNYALTGAEPNETSRGHGDLIVHEIRINGEGKTEHELRFSGGGRFIFVFSDLTHSEVAIEELG